MSLDLSSKLMKMIVKTKICSFMMFLLNIMKL